MDSEVKPAERLNEVQEYYFSRKLREVAEMNAAGKNVISLGIGSPDNAPSKETIQTFCDNVWKEDAHGYQPTVGIPELRNAMADWYQRCPQSRCPRAAGSTRNPGPRECLKPGA